MSTQVQQLAAIAIPATIVVALALLAVWFLWWATAKSAAAAPVEQVLPPHGDLGPIAGEAERPAPRTLTTADRAKANRAEAARIDNEAEQLRAKVAAELLAKKAEQAELESILGTKPETST